MSDATTPGAERVVDLVTDIRMAMLTTTDDEGHQVSRPMAVQEVEPDGDMWFVSDGDARKVRQVRSRPEVNVSFASASSWVSVCGDAEVVVDAAKAEQLWNPVLGAWFPDGPRTPGLVLLRVRAHAAEYWDSPGGRVATVISFAKAKLTGRRYEGGDNEVVEL